MAKSTSVLSIRGTFDKITFVESRTYGKHIRAARGTHTKAEVNEAFKKESEKLLNANVPAKILKDAIDLHRPDFKGGQLWQRLVSMFRQQLEDFGSFDFTKLTPFEVNAYYPFERFLVGKPKIDFDKEASVIKVGLQYTDHPSFKKSPFIDGYWLGVIGIFPDLEKRNAEAVAVYSDVIGLEEKVVSLSLELSVPIGAKCFVLCLKIDGCVKGVVNGTPATKGMRVVGCGKV